MNRYLSLSLVLLLVITVPGVFGWKERLAECERLGIPRYECPDDDSVLVPRNPPPTPAPVSSASTSFGSSGRGSGNHYVWVLISDDGVCYGAYYRYVDNYSGLKIDFPGRKMFSCSVYRPLIGVVLS